jgi:nicotinate-nucleotide pyrophosphorylase (carboxylating)
MSRSSPVRRSGAASRRRRRPVRRLSGSVALWPILPCVLSDLRLLAPLDPSQYRDIVRRALAEDIGSGDITTDATVGPELRARGVFVVKAPCVIAGLHVALEAFRQLEPAIEVNLHRHDGERCQPGDTIGELVGLARTLLVAERTALNFLQRLSGIATRTSQFVAAAAGRIIVLDTRKTTPTLRALEKHAVRAGGATNHRTGLYDAVLIKDNHVRLARGVREAICRIREHHPGVPVEVEAQTLAELDEALEAGADTVLVDNMSLDEIREAAQRARGRARVEISGGVTLERIVGLSTTGADYVSVGALTHSAPAIDISFEIEPL